MICRLFSNHVLSTFIKRIQLNSFYHSDSIGEGNVPDEPIFEEQRLSSQEATSILRTHEASIDLEANCQVKYYDVNYLGANNPPGRQHPQLISINLTGVFFLFSRGSTGTSSYSICRFTYVFIWCI